MQHAAYFGCCLLCAAPAGGCGLCVCVGVSESRGRGNGAENTIVLVLGAP